MTTKCKYRARNSLSFKKFIDRLDKGLPLFVAYGEGQRSIMHHDNCRNLHWCSWQFSTASSSGAEFINTTKHHPSFTYEDSVSLRDMNVYRNKYNKNFAFRTLKAAEQYIQDIS